MHPQVGDDVFAPVVEEVRSFRVRTAVRADVTAYRSQRAHDVRDERAFAAVERVLRPYTVSGREQRLVAIDDIDTRRRASLDDDQVVEPAVAEVPRVRRRRHDGVLGIRT